MHVELDLYAGRPNPGWTLTPDEIAQLKQRLALLPARPAAGPRDEPLGYRGLRITAAGGSEGIAIGAGIVERAASDGSTRQFVDDGRSVECWLLQTAAGRLDEALRQWALAEIGPGCR